MKPQFLTLPFLLFLQSHPFIMASDPITTVDSLIIQRKYATAFSFLDGIPKGNDDRAVVLKKIDIALNYFVLSVNHVIFSFKDLEPDESLMDIRGRAGSYPSFLLPIGSVLNRLIARYPKDGKLYRYLGDYYDDVSRRYSGRWLISDDSLVSLVRENYRTARDLKAANYSSLHRLGVIYVRNGDFSHAEPCFKEAIALSPREADPYYNLAYLFLQRKKPREAIASGLKALDLYQDVHLRSDAGRLVASCYFDLGECDNALKYLKKVDSFDPFNFHVYRSMLHAYLKLGKPDSAFQATKRLFSLYPTYPSSTQAVIREYTETGKSSQVVPVLQQLLPDYSRNDTASGNLYFHIAQFLYEDSKYPLAAQSLDSAETRFRRCYSNDHQAFGAIESLREAVQKGQ